MDKDPAIEQLFLELWNDCYMSSGLCTWSSLDKTPQKRFPVVICSWNSLFLCFLNPDIFPILQNKLNVFHLIFLAFPWNKTQNKISASYIKDGSVIILSFFFPHSQFTVCLRKKKKCNSCYFSTQNYINPFKKSKANERQKQQHFIWRPACKYPLKKTLQTLPIW